MSSMHNKIAYIFNNENEINSAKQKVSDKFPQLRVTSTPRALYVESRNSIVFDSVVESFVRSLGGMPRPADM